MIAEGRQSIKNIFIEDRYFEIPNYQRSYAWQEKQLKDFLSDFSQIENYNQYYYGTILLQKKENCDDSYEIVDGQQRLTTLIIFINCLIKRMKEVGGLSSDASELNKKFIKYKNNYILKLQDQDDGFFKSYILSDNPNPITKTPAQRNLSKAKEYFTEKLKDCKKDELLGYKTRLLAANCLVYLVYDRNEAAMIFETTNDRGKLLTNLEKTKSYLMYKVSTTLEKGTSLLDTIQQTFNDIYSIYEGLVDMKKFNSDEDSIQQYAYIAFESWKNFKKDGKSIKMYQHYLEELKNTVNNLVAEVGKAKTESVKATKEEKLNDYIEKYINNLKSSFNAVKCMFEKKSEAFYKLLALDKMASIYPLLIKAYSFDNTEGKDNFTGLCKWLEIFCFRGLAIIGYQSNKFQDKFFGLARDFNGDFEQLLPKIQAMILELGDDEKFLSKLQDRDFFMEYSQDKNYFFWSYENYLRERQGFPKLTFEDLWETNPKQKLTIEHIVARANEKDKNRIIKDDKYITIGQRKTFDRDYLNSIGNLTIDPLSANASKGKKDVEIKISKYFTGAPLMSQNELEGFMVKGKWTLDSHKARAQKILDFAKEKWYFAVDEKVALNIQDNTDDEMQ